MTRNADIRGEDIFRCTHEPETPISDEFGELVEWRCRCGRVATMPVTPGATYDVTIGSEQVRIERTAVPEPIPLEAWSLVQDDDPWAAPETKPRCLAGRKPDGRYVVQSSEIVDVQGRVVTTLTGSRYRLGVPLPEYLAWMREHGYAYDPENPIVDLRGKKS